MTQTTIDVVAENLGHVPLFHDLPPEVLGMVAAEATTRTAAAGETIFQMGDDGEEMYVVLNGSVQIILPGSGGAEEVVAEMPTGRWFGEMALITGEPRSASARAKVDSDLLVLTRTSFHSLLARVPMLGLRLSEELSRRLRNRMISAANDDSRRVIVLDDVIGDGRTIAKEIAAAIAEELDETVAYVDLEDEGTGTETAPDAPVLYHHCQDLAALERLRRSYATLVVRAPRSHRLSEAVRALNGVRVDSDALSATPTQRSRAQLGILSSPLQQLARRLVGRRVGLVFGAGGAKGLSHVGAIRSFERAGLRFDMLAGTSMGGIVAALVALGWSSDRMLEFAEDVRRNFRRLLIDIGLSGSLLKGDKKRKLLASLTDGKRFEDLPVPLWIVAADLLLQREHVFDRGQLSEAVDATSAIPTVFPVVTLGDRQLVDGWVVNSFPADVLRRKGADIVVGVDPHVADERKPRPRSGSKPKSLLQRLLNPRTLIDPVGIVRVAMQAMDVGARERTMANVGLVDVCVQPALGAYSTTDIQKLDAIVAAGEAAAETAMPSIRTTLRI